MQDADFYIEETSPKKIFFYCLVILFCLGFGVYALYYYTNRDILKLKDVTVELGEKVPTNIEEYLKGTQVNDYQLDVSNVHVDETGNTDSTGEYSYSVSNGHVTKRGKLFVKDTTAPVVTVQNLTVGLDEDFEVDDFIVSCEDLSIVCYVSYADADSLALNEKEGTYNVTIKIADEHGNSVSQKVKLTVSKDASLSKVKASDLEVSEVIPKIPEWNNTFTYKFEPALLDDSIEFERRLVEIANVDYSAKYDKVITERTNLVIYNRYGYALGISVVLKFEDDSLVYVTSE